MDTPFTARVTQRQLTDVSTLQEALDRSNKNAALNVCQCGVSSAWFCARDRTALFEAYWVFVWPGWVAVLVGAFPAPFNAPAAGWLLPVATFGAADFELLQAAVDH